MSPSSYHLQSQPSADTRKAAGHLAAAKVPASLGNGILSGIGKEEQDIAATSDKLRTMGRDPVKLYEAASKIFGGDMALVKRLDVRALTYLGLHADTLARAGGSK